MPRATFGRQLAALKADLAAEGLVDASPPLILLTDRNVRRVARQTAPPPLDSFSDVDIEWSQEEAHDELTADIIAEIGPNI